ncbi:hypothetical protein GWI33_008409 [Rhynchophorus ferrugineus]|uniref:Histone-lysine N-methyltransferase ash1 n=1 Tax=Rhynchophorus ferrugineus TaxID=354439 RepID=A0A834IC17_RHYFE|nr:hypothetical protein GWI33_008409 [Rhynchophorus ferrugineus]
MATNDGTTTELFTGWSSVVHQPEDEPEESELPSTVDIGVLNSGPSDLNQPPHVSESESDSEDSEADSSNSEGSDGSQSCSHSESSDSESSSSSESSSRSPSPEFSVTSSQTNELRMTIATVRKSTSSPVNVVKKAPPEGSKATKSRKKSSSSSSSDCSSDSDSDSDSDAKEATGDGIGVSHKPSASVQAKKPVPVTRLRLAERAVVTCRVSANQENTKTNPTPIKGKTALTTTVAPIKDAPTKDNPKDTKKREKESPAPAAKTRASASKERESVLKDPSLASKPKLTSNTSVKENSTLCKLRSNNASTSSNKEQSLRPRRSKDGSRDRSKDSTASIKTRLTTSKENKDGAASSHSKRVQNTPGESDNTAGKDKENVCSKEKEKPTEKTAKSADSKTAKKKMRVKRRSKKMASLPLSRSSTYSTSESDSSDDLLASSCSLQEIRQEDLAAILPDQNECNDFNDFDKNAKDSPTNGDMSGSDMELPQQAINSLIQRTTESSSDGEGHQLPNPQTLFANSLLQQFVASNPLLTTPTAANLNALLAMVFRTHHRQKRRGRPGRPKKGAGRGRQKEKIEDEVAKVMDNRNSKHVQDFCGGPNVSPDSGIQNSPDHVSSPEPFLTPNIKPKSASVSPSKDDIKKKSPTVVEPKTNSKVTKQEKEKPSHTSRSTSQEKLRESAPTHHSSSDRVRHANLDRVLYPPRRKAGRPPITRRPGRPPKHKTEAPDGRVVDKSAGNVKTKIKTKTGSPNSNSVRQANLKNKSITLKVPKILHSKHKHKHKKRKIKILKPAVSCDPKINQEIEKLIGEFMRSCVIATKLPKENVPEQKPLKKVTKKRRTTDHMEKKKKKQNVNTMVNKVNNSNEQRLPLKKRHYHLVSNSSENQKTEVEDVADKVPEVSEEIKSEPKDTKPKIEKKEKVKESKITPKYVPVIKSHINNNDYEVKTEKIEKDPSHIAEAIKACIHKIVDKKQSQKDEKSQDDKLVPTTTPKKRHRLENLNSSSENGHSGTENISQIKTEAVCVNLEEKCDKAKPKISVEAFINELKMKRTLQSTKTVNGNAEEGRKASKDFREIEIKKESSNVLQTEKNIHISPECTKKKVRKRRAFNRTGFPTVKKKKKRILAFEEHMPSEEIDKTSSLICDRVPKEGEEYTKFMQRSNHSSFTDLTTLDDKSPPDDLMSECESLPQDERTYFDLEDSSSRSDSINESLSETRSKKSDAEADSKSPLESSIERLKSRLDQNKRKRCKDLKSKPAETNIYPKRRKREDSPASSVEPSVENRLRDSTSASGDEYHKKSKKAPRNRKKYLVAGLFSDYYKEDESKRQEITKSSRNLVYNPEDHPYGLLPPPYHCGKYLRCRKVDFQLPYDLWWQHIHSQLLGRDVVPSWNYKKIRTNVYNVKSNGGACEPQPCNCKPSSNCDDDCINRLVLAECPATHRCNNQKIQRHEWAQGIEKFMTENKGWGVRTKEPIKQAEFILEYVGEVVSDQEFKERMNTIYVNDTHHYCLHLDGGLVIDGHRMGGDGRFVNHSCQPNCEMQKWSVNGQFRMALFALRDIEPYEEITYDYNFSLFDPAEGQECKCGSANCRGVIGGKSQRIRQLPDTVTKNPGRVGRPRKTEAKKKPNAAKDSVPNNPAPPQQIIPQIQVKPMSHQQKCFILQHHCFLLRNLTKVRKVRDRSQSLSSGTASRQQAATPTDTSAFMNQLNALQKPRNMKTRRIAQAEDDPELTKTIKLATILKDILASIKAATDDKNQILSTNLMQLPSKRKFPDFYQRVTDPIDITTIEQNIATGVYKNPETFDGDMNKLFIGFAKYYDRTTDTGIATAKLKKIYVETKQQSLVKFEDILGEKPPPAFVNNKKKNEEEDIIRCICGIPRDEGLMIQCERCMVWQHIECVKADASVASYHCEICVPREVDYEIPMDEYTEHGHRYFMTLLRGNLQLRQGDTVYVLRDIPIEGTDKKHTYETIGKIEYSELDIFRIERLWKDKDSGKRFAYGHHFLRPHETFHEPTRKFFPNEVMRVPLYEAVPVELVMEHCWVMDINTYCKGRPIGCQEQHVYICEYRVDKGAKMFSKTSKSKFPVCTKSFAFERFETRLKISRTYCPHDVDTTLIKNNAGRKKEDKDNKALAKESSNINNIHPSPNPPIIRTPAQQKSRLNKILLNLLSKIPTKQVLDVSYLLEGGRRRKKQDVKQ